jgi:hypothetical protein
MLLSNGRADFSRRCADDSRWLAREGICSVRSTSPVDGVLQGAGNRPVVLRRDEQNRVDARDSIFESPRHGWIVRIVVVAIERKIRERNLFQLQLFRRETHQGTRKLPIDRLLGKAADKLSNGVRSHTLTLQSNISA